MALKFTLSIIFVGFSFLYFSLQDAAHSNSSGAPAGRTGSPGDNGLTCASSGCHTGAAVQNLPNAISTNIPATGYVAGQTYQVTISIAQTGINRFGFQASPQLADGSPVGTLVVTNATETQLVGGGRYITHRAQGLSGSGSRSWTFNWIAPPAGSGSFSFYAALMAANGNGTSSGDQVFTSSLQVNEDISMSLNEKLANNVARVVRTDAEDFNLLLPSPGLAHIEIYALSGRRVYERTIIGEEIHRFSLQGQPNGIYILKVQQHGKVHNLRLIKS